MLGYWKAVRRALGTSGVERSALDLGRLRRFLSRIVLLEVREDCVLAVRLCGTLRCQDLGFDPSGMALDDLPSEWAAHVLEGAEQAVSSNEPVAGQRVLKGSDQANAFLRLPLLDRQGTVRFVLCHDEAVDGAATAARSSLVHGDIHGPEVAIAA